MKPLGSRRPKCLVPRAVNAATLSSPPVLQVTDRKRERWAEPGWPSCDRLRDVRRH